MLNENILPKYFWAEAVNTTCYVLNHVVIRSYLNNTSYEVWKDKKLNIGYFKVFGCKCFILNTKNNLGKFNLKSYIGIFLGYSNTSKVYRVYNKITLVVEESIYVTFNESTIPLRRKLLLMMMQMKSYKKNHQNINKRMHHMKIKRRDKKKQIWSKMKVLLKHSLRNWGIFLLTQES